MSDLDIDLMAHNDDDGDWNDLRYKECWNEGYLKGGKAVEKLFIQRIQELEAENAALKAANKDLQSHFDALKSDYDAMKGKK